MNRSIGTLVALAVACAAVLGPGDAAAEKPAWAGQGKGRGHDKGPGQAAGKGQAKGKPAGAAAERGGGRGSAPSLSVSVHFGDRDRMAVRDYYGALDGSRGCPPGLAKKNNGCLPPGQAKKWAMGRPLPRGIVLHAIPGRLLAILRPAPSGYRYVRIAGDILMIAIGTSIVVDAIEDLGRM